MDKHIATLGCSSSGDIVGDSWPVILGKKLGVQVKQFWSNGSGNEGLNIEKFVHLCQTKPEFIVVGLTAIQRLTLSFNIVNNEFWRDGSAGNDGNIFNEEFYYTFNARSNSHNIKNLTGFDWNSDPVLFNALSSNYNTEFKIFHTLSTYEHIAKSTGTRVYYFSFHGNVTNLIEKYPQWKEMFPYDKWLFDDADHLIEKSGLFNRSPCYHWYADAHQWLVNNTALSTLSIK